jgi:hypothetical protein
MNKQFYIVDIDEARKPFNSYFLLPLEMLEKILPLVNEEVLKGLIDSDDNDRVILHVNLDNSKAVVVRNFISRFEKKHGILIK